MPGRLFRGHSRLRTPGLRLTVRVWLRKRGAPVSWVCVIGHRPSLRTLAISTLEPGRERRARLNLGTDDFDGNETPLSPQSLARSVNQALQHPEDLTVGATPRNSL